MAIKVLHVITWLNPGGIKRWILTMLREIPRLKIIMDICCKGDSVGTLAKDAGKIRANIYQPLRYLVWVN